jgi:hypothetical protein
LRLHDGGLALGRAVAPRPQREHRSQQRRQRQTDRGRKQFFRERVHDPRKINTWLHLAVL